MRFALLGSHPDGLEMASALVEAGRHELIAYSSPSVPNEFLRRCGTRARAVADLEELLADPAIEVVVVAGSPANRPHQLRRALQSERHVLCVHPADPSPDIGYEAAMIQADTKCILLPLLPDALHPGIARLNELMRERDGAVGPLRFVSIERRAMGPVVLEAATPGHRPSLPDWDVLRRLGGEIAEVSAFAIGEVVDADDPLLLVGRFEKGGLFQSSLQPHQKETYYRILVVGDDGRLELLFPQGWPGPAFLSWLDRSGESHEEAWDTVDPWTILVEVFERALSGPGPASGTRREQLSWQDAVRSLELDDAVRRSVEHRRSSTLEYPEANEAVGFKGTMALVGCGLLWVVLVLLILSAWYPRLGWVIVPVLILFLLLQLFRWIVPRNHSTEPKPERRSEQ